MNLSSIEALEDRIAPAAIVMVTDIDGDTVMVKTSKGTVAQLTTAIKTSGMGMSGIIQEIDFSTAALVGGVNPFIGTDLTVSVVKQGSAGNGQVNVGYIDAAVTNGNTTDGVAVPLGKIKIGGDLGQIDAGSGGSAVAFKALTVASMGSWGLATQGANASANSNILGKVGPMKITGAATGVTFTFNGAVAGFAVGPMFDSSINGSGDFVKLTIGAGVQNGSFAANSITSMQVKGSLNASVAVAGKIGTLKTGGDLLWGKISAVTMTNIAIGGDIVGLTGRAESGHIAASGNIGKVTVGGDLRGASASSSGRISAAGNIDSIVIRGSIVGPDASPDDLPGIFVPASSSAIFAGGNIKGVFVGGSVFGPTLQATALGSPRHAVDCCTIRATGDITTLTIGGSVYGVGGNVEFTSGNVQFIASHLGSITIGGDFTGLSPFYTLPEIHASGSPDKAAIGKLTIGGSLRLATIIAGNGGPTVNADGVIGSVFIRGDIDRATIATLDAGMGIADNVNLTSRIGSITVGGTLAGNSVIRAEHVVAVKIGKAVIKLQPGARNDLMAIGFPPGSASIAEYL